MTAAARTSIPDRIARRITDWWFAAVPAERLAGLRILVGAFAVKYLADRYFYLLGASSLPPATWKPVGVVGMITDTPLDPGTWKAVVIATTIFAYAFVAGVFYRWTAPIFAVLLLFTLSYRNSWTMVFHTENLLVLHVLAMALAPAADAWSVDRWWRKRRGAAPPEPDGKYAWAIRTAAVLTVATYMLAGIAKLRLTGVDWLDGVQLRNQIGFDNLRKALLGDQIARLAVPLLEHPSLFIALSIMTLMVELGAPFALLGGRIAALWALAAWGFHVGVIALMAITFPYPLYGVAYAPLFRVERPMGWIARKLQAGWARIRKQPGAASTPSTTSTSTSTSTSTKKKKRKKR